MAVTLKKVNNIYADWVNDSYTDSSGTHYIRDSVGYYIIPSKLKFSNIDWAQSTISSAWTYKGVDVGGNPVRILLDTSSNHLYCQHTYGINISAYTSGDPTHSLVTAPLVLTFKKAAQNIRSGKLHDLKFTVNGVDAYSRSTVNRYIAIINLTDDDYTPPGNYDAEHGFNVQANVEQIGSSDSGNLLVGVDVRVSFQVLDLQDEVVDPQSRFPFPFQDIDFTYDVITNTRVVNGACSESVQLMQGWGNPAYVYDGTYSEQGVTIDKNWLVSTPDSPTPSFPNRIYNGRNQDDDTVTSEHTSMVCLLNAGGSDNSAKNIVRWFGSACNTSLKGKNIATYSVTVNANGGSFNIGNTTTSTPQVTYKLSGVDLTVSYSLGRPGYICLGYSTNPNATAADYSTTFVYDMDANITLYAVWEQLSSPILIKTPTTWLPYKPTDPSDPSATGYVWRAQHGPDPNNPDPNEPLAWHLVRPIYVCKTVNGVKQWVNCEDLL